MWTVIKFKKQNLELLKEDLKKKVGQDCSFYLPKILVQKYVKNKLINKEKFILGDYLFCFHKNFEKKNFLTSLKYCKGLKYFLTNFSSSQKEIENFISKCKENEDTNGYLKQSFFNFGEKSKYQFISGPFTNLIFTIFKENKFSIEAIMGKYNMTVSKEDNLYRPV